jgi:dipeptidyl aminopeptidase/acylaminoacyl peptidase
MTTRRFDLLPALLLAAFSVAAAAQPAPNASAPAQDPRIAQILGQLEKVRAPRQVAISPDGQSLAWVVGGEHGAEEIELAPTSDPSHPSRVSVASKEDAPCKEDEIAWSQNSKTLAFLSNCLGKGQDDLYLAEPATGKAPRRLTHLTGFVDSPQWSPDGSSIAFLYVEGATRPSGALAAMKPPSGVIGVEGVEIQRVAAVDAASGNLTQVTPVTLHVYEFDWSPDSRQLAYVAAPPPGENNWWLAKLFTQPVNKSVASPILDPTTVSGPLHGLQIAVPRWSPDGKNIAFIGGLMSDQGATGGDLYVIPAAGGELRNLTTSRKSSPAWLRWESNNQILVAEIHDGTSHYALLDSASGDDDSSLDLTFPASIGDGRVEMSVSSASDASTAAYISSTFEQAPEVFTATNCQSTRCDVRQITHYNDALKPDWGKSESVTWKSDDFHVQGWLLYPANYDPAKKYPLIVMVHGGPSSAVLPHWPYVGFGGAPFSALGYFVLMPNPRGSFGQGESFVRANVKDFGYGDLRDIEAGVDTVSQSHPIDPARVGITGWSYGGFMTMFAVTQTQRFHAAVAGAGISNWQSYYGENSIDQWMIPFFGASVYDDPAVYAKSSAINFIHQAKTPTLVVVGDRDGECPAPQSFEFWHALRAQGTPTQLVVYPDEGHGFRLPEHRRDVLERALAWFQQYMPPQP